MNKWSKNFKMSFVLMCLWFLNISFPNAASTGTLGISGSSSQTVGKTFTLEFGIVSNTGSVITAQGNVTVDDTNCVKLKSLKNAGDTKFTFMDMDGKTGTFTIVRGTFEAGSKACTTNVKISGGGIAFADDTSLKNLTASKTINVGEEVAPTPTKSSDATLKSLSPNVGTLSPSFKSSTTTYSLEVADTTTSIKFNATPNHSAAKITSGSTCNLSGKTTTCKIVVTAENNATKTYTINVTKKDAPQSSDPEPSKPDEPTQEPSDNNSKSSDATLKNLEVDGYSLSPRFSKDVTSYNINVGSKTVETDVEAVPNDENAKVKITGNSGWKEGMNTITITVTAEDGTKEIYSINVYKKASDNNAATNPVTKSSDNTLKNIIIKNGEISPAFDKNVNNYTVNIPNDVEKLDISTFTNDKKAKVKITGNENLKVGMNTVAIEVTAEDGSIRYYTINVNKSEKASNNKLGSLKVDGYDISPTFDKNIFSYELSVPNDVNSINVNAVAENEKAKVEVIGNKDLKEGNNVVLIKVTDEDGFTQYYTVNVNKEPKQEAKFLGLTWKSWLFISGFLLLLGLLIAIIALLKKRKEKVKAVKNDIKEAPIIEFKPEFNFGSKNGTDDDIVEEGGVLNQYSGIEGNKETPKEIEYVEEANYQDKPERKKDIYDYEDDDDDYEDEYDDDDDYRSEISNDETITKAEIVDAIHEAIATKDPEKLQLLLDQDELNQRKKRLKQKEAEKRKKNRYDYDD